ncbi:hypothetical protein BDZ91DRAFT_743602 [Kalaharituber pfeilii]|nr:hypothetical protein BDZ91DRAFT_743602 [Kalaharituber pfeilii]
MRGLFSYSPGTTHYTPSECTVTDHSDHESAVILVQELNTKLAIADDSLQTKQIFIDQLEARIKELDQQLGNNKEKAECERRELEVNLENMNQRYCKFKENVAGEKRQLELDLENMDKECQAYKKTAQEERKQLELELENMSQQHQAYKEEAEGKRRQLELDLDNMDKEYVQYKEMAEGERKQLERNLMTIGAAHEHCGKLGPARVVLKSSYWHFKPYIEVENQRLTMNTPFNLSRGFAMLIYPDGMVSFQTIALPIKYLSADASDVMPGVNNLGGTVMLSGTCGSREKFWLHLSENDAVFIEPVDFRGRFLTRAFDTLLLQGSKSHKALFSLL